MKLFSSPLTGGHLFRVKKKETLQSSINKVSTKWTEKDLPFYVLSAAAFVMEEKKDSEMNSIQLNPRMLLCLKNIPCRYTHQRLIPRLRLPNQILDTRHTLELWALNQGTAIMFCGSIKSWNIHCVL